MKLICLKEEISDGENLEPVAITDEQKKRRLLKKIRSIGKLSNYYKRAADHNALVAKLNGEIQYFYVFLIAFYLNSFCLKSNRLKSIPEPILRYLCYRKHLCFISDAPGFVQDNI